ncbi:winged helix-turn-helix domain-containing protein [Streptomyces sp. NPDC004111]|uniref:winged helix-turn-helix domain-containing protein n=1 Tax=Streptomyces sp. NPDC004111 TaxID=3364690 RepID=UPI00367BB1C9
MSATDSRTKVGTATATLRARIASGRYKPGTALPLLRSLAADLGVGTQSLSEALNRLRAEGLIVRARGGKRPCVAITPAAPSPVAHVAQLLRTGVADGTYRPGDPISVADLAVQEEVSIPVALLGCSWARHEGYLTSSPLTSQRVLYVSASSAYAPRPAPRKARGANA